jgi:hypothetical protein
MRRQGRIRIAVSLLALVLAPAVTAQPRDTAPAAGSNPPAPAGSAGNGAGHAPGAEAPGDAGSASATVAPDREALDIDALRQEYLRLRDELFRSRARAATVASALYSTRMRIHLDYESARFHAVTRATIRLDGAGVYDDAGGAIGTDQAPRFEGYVAPGRHQIGIRIEAQSKDDDRFATIVDNTFTIQAIAGKDVVIRARARDGGDIAHSWEKKQRGSYGLHLDVVIEAVDRDAADAATGVRRRK